MKKNIKIILLVAVILLITCGITYSKYISNYVWDHYLKSKGFYFNSDVLSSNAVTNSINSWDGSSVHFNIRNNFNKSLISEVDINYTVTCTITTPNVNAVCSINDTNNGVLRKRGICVNNSDDGVNVNSYNETDCNDGGYTYTNQISDNDLSFDIDSQDELTDLSVNITVAANSPYTKTISGNFLIHKSTTQNEVEVDYNRQDTYDKLVITNRTDSTKCVLIAFDPSKLIIDNELTDFVSYSSNNLGYINEIKISIDSNEMKDYNFYKIDSNAIYNVNEFNITDTVC